VLSELLQHQPDVVRVLPPGQRWHCLNVHLKGEEEEMKGAGKGRRG